MSLQAVPHIGMPFNKAVNSNEVRMFSVLPQVTTRNGEKPDTNNYQLTHETLIEVDTKKVEQEHAQSKAAFLWPRRWLYVFCITVLQRDHKVTTYCTRIMYYSAN